MEPRWKGKGAEAKALAEPMSVIVSQLSTSLTQSNAQGLLFGSSVLLAVEAQQTELLIRACFGHPIVTAERDKQWFKLGMEEAFYLSYNLKCLKILGDDDCEKTDVELWQYMNSMNPNFPVFYKGYSHLRKKNWVVRPGSQFGVDFVAYRHHPSLVHSEYGVLVLSGEDGDANGRLRVWSDFHCTVRFCGSVAKTVLVLSVGRNSYGVESPSCLDEYSVKEYTIMRWKPQQSVEAQNHEMDSTTKPRRWDQIRWL